MHITKCILLCSTALKICIQNPPNNLAKISNTDSKLTPRWKERSGADQKNGCGGTISAASPGCARIPSQELRPPRERSRPGRRGASGTDGQIPCPSSSTLSGLKGERKKKKKASSGKIGALCSCVYVCAHTHVFLSLRDKVLVPCISLSPQGYLITADR